MPFVKGQSGNPSGRPQKTKEQRDFEAECRRYVKANGIEFIIKTFETGKYKEKVWALETMLDRGFGKPPVNQTIDADINDTRSLIPDFAEFADRARRLKESYTRRIDGTSNNPESIGMDPGK